MRIVLLGPVYPYRGGLAHFTALLANNLAAKHEVRVLSYKRLYPPFLYPGKNEKDTVSKIKLAVPADYVIDVINPLSWFRAFRKIRDEKADLVIVQWAVYFFTYFYIPIFKLVRKFTHTKILFDCHNVLPHEKRALAVTLTKMGMKLADCYMVHSNHDLDDLTRLIPNPVVKKASIPIYEGFDQSNLNKQEARRILGVDGNVLLFFGLIREYKGVDYLLKSLPDVLKKMDVTLIIAGEFWDDKKKYLNLVSEYGLSEHVRIVSEYIPNEDVEVYFRAADVVVLPYVSATQTAVIPLAVSFGIPVICTNVGGLPELVVDGETGFVVPPRDERALAEAMILFFEENKASEFVSNIKKNKSLFSWDRMVGTIEVLADLVNQ